MLLIVLNHSIQIGLDYTARLGYAALPSWSRTGLSVLQAFGAFAVPIFLFISGSFVAYAAQGKPPRLSAKFLGSSLRHILIPYLIWSAIFYVEVYFLRDEQYTADQYVKNLLVGYPYHFIPLLFFFYILSPLLVRLSQRFAGLLLAMIAIYQIFLLNIVYSGVLGFSFPEWAQWLSPPVLRQTLADWAIFFPLGLVYGLNTRKLLPQLRELVWFLASLAGLLFTLGLLDAFKVIHLPIARHICTVPFVLLLPAIKRESIPLIKVLEQVGRRSYGVYLTHLIALDSSIFILYMLVPGLLALPALLFPALFLVGCLIPLLLMELGSRKQVRRYYRYVFG